MSTSPQQTFPLSGVYLPLAPTPNPTGFVPPPPCLPQLRCLPPPLPLPPPPPPPPPLAPTYTGFHSNNWTNPSTTYTRVAVEDLFVTNTVSAKMPMVWPPSTRSSQLNPNANPFQPAYQRSQPLPQAHRSSQPAIVNPLPVKSTANLKQTTSHNTSPPSETKRQRPDIVPSHSLPQNTYMSRGTMYFGQATGSLFEDENETTVASDTETSVEPEKKPQLLDSMAGILKPVPKRDIAKMMWEAADLYDNAIRTIQERRAELQKLKERKKSKNKGEKAKESTDSTDDIDPEVIVRDIVKSSHRKAARERRHGADQTRKPFVYLMQDPCPVYLGDGQSSVEDSPTVGKLSQAKLPVWNEEITTKAADSRAIKSKSRSVPHTLIGKEVTVDELASAIIRMETDLFKRKGAALYMSKAAVGSVIEEVQRYIIDQLKLDPVRAQDRTPRGTSEVQEVRLEGVLELCELTEESDKRTGARNKGNGILTYEGKEVTVKVIVKAIVKMIRGIYGRRPPFRISRSALTEFIANKQEKILKVLKLTASDWTNSDELKTITPVITEVQSKNQKVKELLEFTASSLKTARAPKARRKIKPIFIRRRLSSIENKKVRKKKGRPADDLAGSQRRILKPLKNRPRPSPERPSKEKSESVNTATGPLEKGTMGSSIQSHVRSVPETAGINGEERLSADDESNGTSRSGSSKELPGSPGKFPKCFLTRRGTFRYRTERSFYSYSANSRYRGRLHKVFVSGMSPRNGKKASPKKRISTESVDEGKTATVNSSDVIPPAVTDSSSIYGRMTAAPASIVIRTVEKKSKKRGKKGWRKSWI